MGAVEDLKQAIKSEDFGKVDGFLADERGPRLASGEFYDLLKEAVAEGKVKAVQSLLDRADALSHMGVANAEGINKTLESKVAGVVLADNSKMLELIFEQGIPPTMLINEATQTNCLYLAAQFGKKGILDYLLKNFPDLAVTTDAYGKSALDMLFEPEGVLLGDWKLEFLERTLDEKAKLITALELVALGAPVKSTTEESLEKAISNCIAEHQTFSKFLSLVDREHKELAKEGIKKLLDLGVSEDMKETIRDYLAEEEAKKIASDLFWEGMEVNPSFEEGGVAKLGTAASGGFGPGEEEAETSC